MKNNFILYFLFSIAIIAFANLFVFLTIGTIISTALLVVVFVVSLIYVLDADSTKDKTYKDMSLLSKEGKRYKHYLEAISVGVVVLDRNRTVVFTNDYIPHEIAEDLKKENPNFNHFWGKFNSFLELDDDKSEVDFTLGNRSYSLKIKSFTPDDEELILIVFADKVQKGGSDIKKVYGKFWNFLKIGPISVLNNYLEGLRDSVGEISQDIFLSETARKQLDDIMRILDRSRDDIENLSLMVNTPTSKLEEVDIVEFYKKKSSDLSADKDYIKIKVIDNLKEPAQVMLDKSHTSKILKNISDNVSEFTRSKKMDIEFNYTFEAGTNNRVVEVRFISSDANIDNNIFKGLGKGIKTSKKGKHLGLGLEIVKKLTIAQEGNVEFRNASNGFTVAVTYKV